MFLSDVSSVKILGRSLRAARRVKPSEIDGDGDGFLTGPDGRDNIPAPERLVDVARSALPSGGSRSSGGSKPSDVVDAPKKHSGSRFLDLFDSHTKAMEEKFGDLRDADNVRRAVKQTFPNLTEFLWLDSNQKTLNDEEHARVVALLHLGQDKDVARNLTSIGWLPQDEADAKVSAAVVVGIKDDTGPEFFHGLQWNKDMVFPPADLNDRAMVAVNGGWGDVIANKMLKEGVPEKDIMRFWTHYVMHHEWTHAEHRKAAFEKMGFSFSTDARELVKSVLALDGMSDAQFKQMVQDAINKRKIAIPNESAADLEINITRALLRQHRLKIKAALEDGMKDDMTQGDFNQLGENYSRMVSGYAAFNFNELVAEKASAARVGYDLGANNPSWRKFNAWMYAGKGTPAIDTTGMTRQERRAAERRAAKKKDARSDFLDLVVEPKPKPFNLRVDTCDGFRHLGGYSGKKSLLSIKSIKFR